MQVDNRILLKLTLQLEYFAWQKEADVLKKVHNLSSSGGSARGGRLRKAAADREIPFLESHSSLRLRLCELQMIFVS